MTVPAQVPSIDYVEDGGTTEFPVPFRYDAPRDILATRISVAGDVAVLVYGVDYSVSVSSSPAGGTLTVTSAAASGTKLRIKRSTARVQPTKYETLGKFTAASHEEALDRFAMMAQEIGVEHDDLKERVPQVPEGESAPQFASLADLADGDLLEFRGGKLRRFDSEPFSGKFYAGDASGRPVPAAGTGGGDSALRGDLADPDAGGRIVGRKYVMPVGISGPATYPRTVAGTLDGNRSILDIVSPAKQGSLLAGVKTDCTEELIVAGLSGLKYRVPPCLNIKVTHAITFTDGFGLIGEAMYGDAISTIYFEPEAGYVGDLFNHNGANDVAIRHLRLIGPGRDDPRDISAWKNVTETSGSQQVDAKYLYFYEWPTAGIFTSGQFLWSVRHCYFWRCGNRTDPQPHTGGIVLKEHEVLPGWAGSGDIFANNYFTGCSYGIYNDKAWNIISDNNIFEYSAHPFYKSAQGTMMTVRGGWSENNDNDPVIEGSVLFMSGRGVGLTGLRGNGRAIVIDGSGYRVFTAGDPSKSVLTLDQDGIAPAFGTAVKAAAGFTSPTVYRRATGIEGYAAYDGQSAAPSQVTSGAITAATAANPVELTVNAIDGSSMLLDGDVVTISDVEGMEELNGLSSRVAVTGPTTIELLDIDGTTFSAYTEGGLWTSDRPRRRVAGVYAMARTSGSGLGMAYGRVGIYTGQHDGGTDNNVQLRWEISETGQLLPVGVYSIGSSSSRVGEIFTSVPVNVASDARLKQDVRAITVAEGRVAASLRSLIRAYRMIREVERDGEAAKIHFGVIAQDVVAAFAAEGLDAADYALVRHDSWWEQDGGPAFLDENGEPPEGAVLRDEYSVVYDELQNFILAHLS